MAIASSSDHEDRLIQVPSNARGLLAEPEQMGWGVALPAVDPNVRVLFMQLMEALAVVQEQVPAVLPVLFTAQRIFQFKVV